MRKHCLTRSGRNYLFYDIHFNTKTIQVWICKNSDLKYYVVSNIVFISAKLKPSNCDSKVFNKGP